MGGRGSIGVSFGTRYRPQLSLRQLEYAIAASRASRELERKAMVDEALLDELEGQGVKLSREDVVFVTRDRTGQVVWLERGSAGAGLEHILHHGNGGRGHAQDYLDMCGVSEKDVPLFLFEVMRYGTVLENKLVKRHGREGFSRTYLYRGRTIIMAGVGTNGFIVSAYPVDR